MPGLLLPSVRAQRARFAPGARKAAQPHARSPPALGARAAPHASRRARGRQLSRMPGLLLLSVRAQRARFAPGARKAAQPHARNQNEREVLDDQIAIRE